MQAAPTTDSALAPGALDFIADPGRAAVLLDPLRIRLVEELRRPDSASGLARRLNLPRQKVNYHLRELEREGFVELIEERRKGNCIERIVRATARYYLITPAVLGNLAGDAAEIQDRMSSAYLVATAARAIRDVADLRHRAGQAGKRLATLTLEAEIAFASPESRAAFTEELTAELARLVAKYHHEHTPGARRFRFFVGGYPAAKRAAKDDGERNVSS